MASNNVIVIAVVAVVAVAAVAGALVLTNNGGDKVDTKLSDVRFALQILGNANEDTVIDNTDVVIIEKIISGELKYEDYPYADANNDKQITDADLDLVKKLKDRVSGTTAYVVNTDSRSSDSAQTITKVTYPLTKIVPYGVNIVEPIIAIDGGRSVAAYFASGYPVQEASMKGTDLKGGSRTIGDAAWERFLEADAATHFDCFILTYDARAQVTDTYYNDLVTAEIPVLCFPAASPDGEADAALTIGFLLGGNSEKLGVKYANIYNEVLDTIKDKVGSLTDSEKTVYLAMTMYTSICQNDSTYQLCGIASDGMPYNKVDETFANKYKGTSSTASTTVEALANLNMQKIVNYRSMDQVSSAADIKDAYVETFEYTNSKGVELKALLQGSKLYNSTNDSLPGVYLINNTLPAPVRVAYTAAVLYDSLTFDWAKGIMQEFIDEKFTSFEGKNIDQNIVTCFGYDDYKAAKA